VRCPAAGAWFAAVAISDSDSKSDYPKSNHWLVHDRSAAEWESLMKKAKLEGNGGLDASTYPVVEGSETETLDQETIENPDRSELVATVATVAVVGVGAAIFEAALLPGLVLGVAAMWAPQYFPKMGEALNPLFRSTVRGAYKLGNKTREMMAEAQEQVHDIVAEVHAEDDMQQTKAGAN
jgi:hypothetical protein